jgi:hypothetical protein
MKREIKFRAWDFEAKEMIYPSLPFNEKYVLQLNCEYMGEFNGKTYDTIKMPLMQFTGLKDRHGKEIYEGDILKLGDTCSFVVWCLDRWRFNSYMERGTLELYPYVDRTNGKEIAEVIGNIYENPYLLKQIGQTPVK